MPTTGERLRQAREGQSLSLDEVATRTRINGRFLAAIENDEPDGLPGAFFYKSFVTQYAAALGLDPAQWEAGTESAAPSLTPAPQAPPPPSPVSRVNTAVLSELAESPMPGREPLLSRALVRFGLLVVAVAACSGLYALWDRNQKTADPVEQTVQTAPPSPAPSQPVTPAAPETAPLAEPSASPANTPVPTGETASLPAVMPGQFTVSVSVTEPTWFSFTADGKTVYSSTMQPGEARQFTGTETGRMLIGNAGGVQVSWNGKPIEVIGPRGQVRTILFSPAQYTVQLPQRKEPSTASSDTPPAL